MVIEPHDLLKIGSVNDLQGETLPQWARTIFPESLTVVVRRSPYVDGRIPVGIRGVKREQRFASFVDQTNVQKKTTPYDLVEKQAWQNASATRIDLPAMQALPLVAKVLQGYHWGISGSVGFELATQTPTAKVTSDLDLVWKPTDKISKLAAKELLKSLNGFGVHADLQVIQGTDGFSLEEYANSQTSLMMKTLGDPILVTDPWQKR